MLFLFWIGHVLIRQEVQGCMFVCDWSCVNQTGSSGVYVCLGLVMC